jgi:hypothetical protein
VKELEEANALKDAEIQRLQNQIDLLSKLSISVEGLSNAPQFFDTHTLKVDQAVVGHVVTGERSSHVAAKSTDTEVSHLPESYASQNGITLTPAEQRKLDSIIQRFQRLPKLQRSILRLLFEHEGSTMTVPMMASWLSLKESTIRNHPPYDLIRMKLVTRVRGKRGYKYTSSVSIYFRSEFPNLEPDTILREIF